ncbi:MAG: amylo-alpha-1,6-glucosidase [Verrucomicrobiia bacterium]
MEKIIRQIDLAKAKASDARQSLRQEWLATNGLGGYAAGTISGTVTWRYHGLLIAALPAPHGRMVMFNHLAECLRLPDGRLVQFGGQEPVEPYDPAVRPIYLAEFRLENQLPVWRYEVEGFTVEKHVLLLHGQNTVHVGYRLLSGQGQTRLELQPSFHFRGHERPVSETLQVGYLLRIQGKRFEIVASSSLPVLRLYLRGENTTFTYASGNQREIHYRKDAERGYESRGVLWSPGSFGVDLPSGKEATLIASTEPWNVMLALSPDEALEFYHSRRARLISRADPRAQRSPAADLVLAADQFIINPVGRVQDTARAHASGDQVRTVIAGYHWFTDWGRDTMISLEGLTLVTGRHNEAGWILRTFAHYVRDGLIPNLFPEGDNQGLYHTADASLWFFHALGRYLEYTQERSTLRQVLPKLVGMVEHHSNGTHFGIGADPADGLLVQGAKGYQLTWMDAKVEDWVVTPRRGKAVEINALWYNALRLLETWLREEEGDTAARPFARQAERVRESFNARFWNHDSGFLYDVVDGENLAEDVACRPNQILAVSLPHPVLDESRWKPVIDKVQQQLLTPVGLRSLSPSHPQYKAKYFGDLRARDAAYHQGTVWAWLIGPFIDAWLKVHPGDRSGARRFLDGFWPHLDQACIGSINEIFDAEPPFTPRGCVAQAWSVAEVLRAWIKTAESPPGNQDAGE